jgi:hypothetical protein
MEQVELLNSMMLKKRCCNRYAVITCPPLKAVSAAEVYTTEDMGTAFEIAKVNAVYTGTGNALRSFSSSSKYCSMGLLTKQLQLLY